MKKLIRITAIALMLVLCASAFAQALTVSFDSNITTGYVWTAFVIAGDCVEVADNEGEYVSQPIEGNLAGVGGTTHFELIPVKAGEGAVLFTYRRPWESMAAEQVVYCITVTEDLTIASITEGCTYEGIVTAVDEAQHSIVLDTLDLSQVVAVIDADMALPVTDEHILLYTNGSMTKSLPAIVNALAWESVPEDTARSTQPSFDELTGLSSFLANVTEQNPIVSAYFSEGDEMNTEFTTEDADEIAALVEAVSAITLDAPSDIMVTDWYPLLVFTAADGSSLSVGFNGRALNAHNANYELANAEALWKLTSKLEIKYCEDD